MRLALLEEAHLTPRAVVQGARPTRTAKGGADKDGKAPPPKHKVLKIFRDMPERNHASLMLVYRRAAELFSKVEALIAKYRPWVAIGLHEGSLDDLVDARDGGRRLRGELQGAQGEAEGGVT